MKHLSTNGIDMSPDANLDRVGRIAAELGDRIRDEDPAKLFEELKLLCRYHPTKAAQLLMCHAAWFDPDVDESELIGRARSIAIVHPALGATA